MMIITGKEILAFKDAVYLVKQLEVYRNTWRSRCSVLTFVLAFSRFREAALCSSPTLLLPSSFSPFFLGFFYFFPPTSSQPNWRTQPYPNTHKHTDTQKQTHTIHTQAHKTHSDIYKDTHIQKKSINTFWRVWIAVESSRQKSFF